MARTNAAAKTLTTTTHEGGTAGRQTPLAELRRAVSTCMLWESTFYEKGSDIADRIAELCGHVRVEDIAALAVEARTHLKLRHVPLFLIVQALKHNSAGKHGVALAETIDSVVQRPDEMGELLALYWKDGRKPLSAQLKRGLATAFPRFNEYQLAKWNRDAMVQLRDVLFLCHAKPADEAQALLWKRLVAGELDIPDTWETALSAGADKKATWERLLADGKLGYMALLMNLRNMVEANVEPALVESALRDGAKGSRALPFRFVAAAKHAPRFAAALSDAMLSAIEGRLDGDTILVVDVSGSMNVPLSAKSQMTRMEAAGALAVLIREITPACRVFTFSGRLEEVGNYHGLPLLDGIVGSQPHGATHLAAALEHLQPRIKAHRIVVVTDEQTHDGITPSWAPHGYIINVAPYKPGLDTSGGWTRINGFSERVVEWMAAGESGGA